MTLNLMLTVVRIRDQTCAYEISARMGRPTAQPSAVGSGSTELDIAVSEGPIEPKVEISGVKKSNRRNGSSRKRKRKVAKVDAIDHRTNPQTVDELDSGKFSSFTPGLQFQSEKTEIIYTEDNSLRLSSLGIGTAASKELDSSFDLAEGMDRLRVTNDIRTTFSQFSTTKLGHLAKSFYGLITLDDTHIAPSSSAPSSPSSSTYTSTSSSKSRSTSSAPGSPASSQDSASAPPTSRAAASARFYYESAIKGIKPGSIQNEPPESRRARIGETYMLWERWGPEIIKYSTIGVPSGRGTGNGEEGEEPLVRSFRILSLARRKGTDCFLIYIAYTYASDG
jgi:hypothetical protein